MIRRKDIIGGAVLLWSVVAAILFGQSARVSGFEPVSVRYCRRFSCITRHDSKDVLPSRMSSTMKDQLDGSGRHRKFPSQDRQRPDRVRRDWVDRSLKYYSKVMREERRRKAGQIVHGTDFLDSNTDYQDEFLHLARIHYFALRKIKDGKHEHAEKIYRRIIDDLLHDDDACDHAKLAVTTLLLALHLQRMGELKKTRSVFLSFFRTVVMEEAAAAAQDTSPEALNSLASEDSNCIDNGEKTKKNECACSAKVLQAYALFEMKQGNSRKSLEIVRKAIQLDRTLAPVLNWKQFRDVSKRR